MRNKLPVNIIKTIKGIGIFGKTFFYTLTLILIIIIIAVAFFANQFVRFYAANRENQITETMQPFIQELNGKSKEQAVKIAGEFVEKNSTVASL